MRLLVQSVINASVQVKKEGYQQSIGKGLLIYVGISKEDIVSYKIVLGKILNKITSLKCIDVNNKIDKSLTDLDGEILLIPNFTLYGKNKKGTKIDFSFSADFSNAKIIYDELLLLLLNNGLKVKSGIFGGYMVVKSENVGPINYVFDF